MIYHEHANPETNLENTLELLPFSSFLPLPLQTPANTLTAAMPSLHFGYSFVIGLTIATMPNTTSLRASLPSSILRRTLLVTIGMSYPLLILLAIVATANHYILDAAAGFVVALLGWHFNGVLCNLLPLEDLAFWMVRIHKPMREGDREAGLMSPVLVKGDDEEGEWWRRA